MPKFDGETYESKLDSVRLSSQLERVQLFMRDGQWRTLPEIQEACGGTTPSVSARLRDLRKDKFGGHQVDRQRIGEGRAGIFAYRVISR